MQNNNRTELNTMNTDEQMNAIVTPYAEPNTQMMEIYESFYYDDIDVNHTFPKPKKYVRQYNMPNIDMGGIDFDDDSFNDDSIVPTNLEAAFDNEHHVSDLIANIGACYPTLHLKDIAEQLNRVYSDSESMETFVPGQRIGDYEYIVSETNYCIIIFGRKQPTDDYTTIHYWLK